jgi:hypothetical protein
MEFREKRRLLYGRGLEAERARVARSLVHAGRLAEAMEYIEKAKDDALLAEVRRAAVLAGDAFSLLRACQILRVEPEAAEWRDLAARAEAAERWYDAVNALERAGEQEKADALRAQRCPEFRPFKPAGK